MYFTASQSRKHWCPFSNAAGAAGGCISNRCAAWRWAPGQGVDVTGQVEQRRATARRCGVLQPDGKAPLVEYPIGSPEPERHPDFAHDSWTWDDGTVTGLPPAWVEPREQALGRQLGFCGMAQDPQGPLFQVNTPELVQAAARDPKLLALLQINGDALRAIAEEFRTFNRRGDGLAEKPKGDTE